MKILKKILFLAGMLAVSAAFFSCGTKSAGPAAFTKGLNLSKWFENEYIRKEYLFEGCSEKLISASLEENNCLIHQTDIFPLFQILNFINI